MTATKIQMLSTEYYLIAKRYSNPDHGLIHLSSIWYELSEFIKYDKDEQLIVLNCITQVMDRISNEQEGRG